MRQQMLEAEIKELKGRISELEALLLNTPLPVREKTYRNASIQRDRANGGSGQ